MITNKNSPSYFTYRPYSLENAESLITKVFDCISQLDWTIKEIPKTGRNGIGCIREAELKIHKNKLTNELSDYRRTLLRYRQTAKQITGTIRNKSKQIKKSYKRLNIYWAQNMYVDSLSGLYHHYTKHREIRNRLSNTLNCLRSSLKCAAVQKCLIKRLPDSDFIQMTADTVFTGIAK